MPALLPGRLPLTVTATGPPHGTEYTFVGLAAAPLPWPATALKNTAHSLVSVVVRGFVTCEVTHLGRDAVYGGGIFLDPSGPNKRFTLRYAFNAPGTRYQKIGTLVEKASPTTAVVYVAAQ